MSVNSSFRLAVVVSHPIQYYAPWFARLARLPGIILHVFYLWDFGIKQHCDEKFGVPILWDIPLLEGYASSFVPNLASDPGTHHFFGLDNPRLVSLLCRWKPDAVLLFGYTSLSHLRILLDPRLWRVPIVFRGDSHDLARSRGWKSFCGFIIRTLLFRRFSAALAVGSANADYLVHHGLRNKVLLAPHCVDNSRFQRVASEAEDSALAWRAQMGIPADAPIILFAGKLESKKRPVDLLEAFVQLSHPSAFLVFFGAGPLETTLRTRAASLPNARVIFEGFQNQRSMPRTYAIGDLFVLPSFGNGETWGLAVNEAMNMARPVIVSNHVGCAADLVLPERTGWIFPAGDVLALQRCLAHALSDPIRLRRMGLTAREHIAKYSYAAATHGLLKSLVRVGSLNINK